MAQGATYEKRTPRTSCKMRGLDCGADGDDDIHGTYPGPPGLLVGYFHPRILRSP